MYQPYVDVEKYEGNIPKEELKKYLKLASRNVDILTFNRIYVIGFENLTPFQQEIVKEVVSEYADFIYENEDIVNSYLSNYSINGVNMSFDNSKLYSQDGVVVDKSLYNRLVLTGLCYRGIL